MTDRASPGAMRAAKLHSLWKGIASGVSEKLDASIERYAHLIDRETGAAEYEENIAWAKRASGGIEHDGCNYLAVLSCNKCGWVNPEPNPLVQDMADGIIAKLKAEAATMLEALKEANKLGAKLEDAMRGFHDSQCWYDEHVDWSSETGPTIMEDFDRIFALIHAVITEVEGIVNIEPDEPERD